MTISSEAGDLFATHPQHAPSRTPPSGQRPAGLPDDWQTLAHGWYRHPLHPLYLKPAALTPLQADQALVTLDTTLDWQRPSLSVHGKTHPIPRRQVWMG
ncbi:MAG: hypothetical protein ACTH7C_05420, partial [Cobetia marina]